MFLQLVLITVVLWVVFDQWHRKKVYKSVLKMAEVDFKCYPLIGHAHTFLGSDEDRMISFKSVANESNKNGGLVRYWFGRRLFMVTTDPELIEYLLKTFLEKDYLMDFLREISGNGSIFAPVSVWRPRRKMIAPAFSPKILKQFMEVFADKSEELVHQLRGAADGKPFSVSEYLTRYTMDAVCKTNLGLDVSAQENPNQPFLKAFEMIFTELADKVCQPWLQVQWLYNLLPRARAFTKQRAIIDDFINKVIQQRRIDKKKEINNDTEADRDHKLQQPKLQSFLNMLMDVNDVDSGSFTDLDLRDECVVIALAGTDTSAVSASFTMCMLARHPDVQEKVYEEIKQVFGDSKRPAVHDDLPKLRYLDAVLKETLRLYPPVPVIVRKVDKEVTLKSGETLVPGMGILIHIWGTHRNPQYWGADAEQFRPERFLEPLQHPVQFLPFSQGPRNCLGYQYAMTSVKTALSTVLRTYRVLPYSDPDLTAPGSNGVNGKTKPMRVKFDIMMKDVDNFTIQLESR